MYFIVGGIVLVQVEEKDKVTGITNKQVINKDTTNCCCSFDTPFTPLYPPPPAPLNGPIYIRTAGSLCCSPHTNALLVLTKGL